jgi:CRISPR/Cas system CSM-associated protein Csm3 (group 7 of RAMP superfamily)
MTEWTYHLEFQAPVSVFSGLAVAGLVDRMVMRDHLGLPWIPGSTVKGRWRFFAERFLAALPDRGGYLGYSFHPPNQLLCKNPVDACTICGLFGNGPCAAAFRVGPALLDEPWATLFEQLLMQNSNPVVHPDAELFPGVALSRRWRTAQAGHLFFDEAVPSTVTFSGKIFFLADLSPSILNFLKATARLVDHLGGRKAVGRGLLRGGIQIREVV